MALIKIVHRRTAQVFIEEGRLITKTPKHIIVQVLDQEFVFVRSQVLVVPVDKKE